MDALYRRIRDLRETRGLSLREAAERSGGRISHAHLRALEVGHDTRSKNPIRPNPDTLRIVADIYRASYDELMELAGYVESKNDDDLATRWPNLSPDRRRTAAEWEGATQAVGMPTTFGRDLTDDEFDAIIDVLKQAIAAFAGLAEKIKAAFPHK